MIILLALMPYHGNMSEMRTIWDMTESLMFSHFYSFFALLILFPSIINYMYTL